MEAVALHTFSPSSNDELAFHQNDTLKILNVDNPDWYFGELNGVCGLIPGNYVSLTLPTWFLSLTKTEAVTMLKKRKGSGFQHPEGAFLVRPSESNRNDLSISLRIREVQHFKILRSEKGNEYFLWRAGPSFSSITKLIAHYRHASVSQKEHAVLKDMNLPRVIASYDFESRNPEELTIRHGEIITVLNSDDPDWSQGHVERDGKSYRGIFPTNYVTPYSE